MSIVGAFLPTIFYQIHGNYALDCSRCQVASDYRCRGCRFIEKNYYSDQEYQRNARILMYMCAVLLPLAYIVGLVYSYHTHRRYIHRNSFRKSSMNLSSAQWGRVTCTIILLASAVLLALISRVISTSVKPAFLAMNISIEYAGLFIFPLFTLFPKLVTAIE
jgi:Ca2+:H+ antiporter